MDMVDDSSSDDGGVPLSSQTIRASSYSQKPADPSRNITHTFTVKSEFDNCSDPELSHHVSSEGVWALTKRYPNLTLRNSSVQKLGFGCGVPGAPKGPKGKSSARPVPTSPKTQGVPTGPKALRMSLSGSDGSKLDRAHASGEAKKVAIEWKRITRNERRQMKRESMSTGGEHQSRKDRHRHSRANNKGQDNSSVNTQGNDEQAAGPRTALRQLRSRAIATHFVPEKAKTEAPLAVIDRMDVVGGLSSLTLNPEVQLSNSETKTVSVVRSLPLENPNSRRRQRMASGRGSGLPSNPQKPLKVDNRTKCGNSGKPYKIQKSSKLTKEEKNTPQYKELRLKLRKARLSTSIKGFDDKLSALKNNPSSAQDLNKQIKNLERKKQHAQIRLEKSEGMLDGQEAQRLLRLTSRKGARVMDAIVDDLTAGLEAAMNGVLGREISVA